MNDILKQLTEIDPELRKPFPTNDINKIAEDFRTEFMKLPHEVDFYDDFHFYCVNIAGTLSYVLRDNINQIPQGQIDRLFQSFIEHYQYEFLKDHIANYHHFHQEYTTFEQARKLLLKLLFPTFQY
ncbi:YxiJ family protein [Solibacillus sp. FSL K6-4121]|uniref:YxiJ family protein n=1 Tax=Solibacillus sp. FSL K6-4121 TaxID=2921505 RepID=UPI0030FC33B3